MPNKKYLVVILLFITAGLISAEQDLDSQFLNKGTTSDTPQKNNESSGDELRWRINGYAENENFLNTDLNRGSNKAQLAKLEGHINLQSRYGSQKYFFHAEADVFFYPERGALAQENPHDNGAFELQELYFSAGEWLNFKIGKMLVDYSTADAFSVINVMGQRDLREIFGIRRNNGNRGIFALATKAVLGDFMLEATITPLHNKPLFASANSFWAITPPTQRLVNPLLGNTEVEVSPQLLTSNQLSSSLKNSSGAIRAGSSIAGLDFHLLYFNGIDNSLIFQPTTVLGVTQSQITLQPIYNKIETVAVDLAYVYKRLAARFEGSFTPQKWLVLKNEFQQSINTEITSVNKLAKERYAAYTVGLDYKIYSDESLLLVEFTHSLPLYKKSRYQKEFLTELLLIRYEDKFFDNRLLISVGGILRPFEKNPGSVVLLQSGWNFDNGLELLVGANIFFGRQDELLQPFEDHDYLYSSAKFSF